MNRVNAVDATKSKSLAIILSLGTIGLTVLFIITYAFTGALVRLLILPGLCLALCFAPEEKKQAVISNKIGKIVMYVIFIAYSAWSIWDVISWLLNGMYFVLIPFCLMICYCANCLATLLYYHVYVKGAEDGSSDAPLLNSKV